jgi:hypothetical protein
MSERQRWLESDDVDDEIRTLLRAAPVPRAMTGAERARSARSLARIAALPAAAGTLFWVKNVALAGVLGAMGGLAVSGAVVLADRPEPASPAIPAALPAPRAPEPPATAVASAPPPPAEPEPAVAPRRPPPSVASSPRTADSLAEETAKLERARRALGSDPGGALALLDEHAAAFPSGKLGAERELLAIDALVRLGRRDEARVRARAMLARSPGGLYAERLEKMFGGAP